MKDNKIILIMLTVIIAVIVAVAILPSKSKEPIDRKAKEEAIESLTAPMEVTMRMSTAECRKIVDDIDLEISYNNDWTTNEALTNMVSKFENWLAITKEIENSTTDSSNYYSKEIKKKLQQLQAKEYPVLRKSYTKMAADKLWEHNITVTQPSSSTIEFTGVIFANNANIKSTLETVKGMLHKLRFKKVNFKWIKHDDEYTYYNLTNFKDDHLGDY